MMRCRSRPAPRPQFDHVDNGRFAAGEPTAELPGHRLDAGPWWQTFVDADFLLGVAPRTGRAKSESGETEGASTGQSR